MIKNTANLIVITLDLIISNLSDVKDSLDAGAEEDEEDSYFVFKGPYK